LYRLLEATGREKGGLNFAPTQADLAIVSPVPHNNQSNDVSNYTQTFEYDKLGNILNMSSQNKWSRNYFYDTATNQLQKHDEFGQNEYTYDAHGNMLSIPGISEMVWDFGDKLNKTISGTVISYYNYDSGGERTRKVVLKQGGIREERYYINGYEVYRKFISDVIDTERQTLHIADDSKRFAIIDTLNIENGISLGTTDVTIRYQYDNHLGSASLELDEFANIISYEEYHPFGTSSYRLGTNEAEVQLKRYRYVGKERDEETGLYYYGARYYAGWLCRFVSVDPKLNEMPHFSSYTYCYDNPMKHIDDKGKKPKVIVTNKEGVTNIRIENTLYITNRHKKKFDNFETMINDINEKYLKGDSFNLIDFSTTGLQKDGTFKFDKQKINMEIETKYEVVKNRREAKQKIDESGGFGVILNSLPPKSRSNAFSLSKYSKINLEVNDGAYTLAHEIGHTFGFADKYVDIQNGNYLESHPLVEYEGALMSGTGDGLNMLERVSIAQNIINYNTEGVINALPINTIKDRPFKKGDVVQAKKIDYNIGKITDDILDVKIIDAKNCYGIIQNNR